MRIITLLLCLAPLALFAQTKPQLLPHQFPGYVNGIRLDSIDVKYAQVEVIGITRRNHTARFQYGQTDTKRQGEMILNSMGNEIEFISWAALLNFLDDSGWECITDAGTSPWMIVRRKVRPAGAQ